METPGRIRCYLRQRPRVIAVGPAVALFAMSVGSMYFDHGKADPSVLSWLLIAVATLPLVLRYRYPLVVLVTVTGATIWLDVARYGNVGWIPVLIAAFTLTSRRERAIRREAVMFWGAVVTIAAAGAILGDAPVPALVSAAVLIALALVVGDNVRRRRSRAAELADQAEREQREQLLLAEQRVRDERSRIARELHDVVAHGVSVMVIQAAAARRQLASHPERAALSMTVIEDTGRTAMAEMRRLLGVLRDGDAPSDGRAPQPSLASLDELVAAGDIPVELHTEGDRGRLPPAVELSAYRVVQEALTNVRRHAGVVRNVDVRLARLDGALCVEVLDDGRGGAAGPPGQPGYGLVGMRERVALFGGDLQAGPRPGGGWRVRARIPTVTG